MGSGKTALASKVIDSFLSEKRASSTRFAYFYCARNSFERERSDPDHILRSLVRQMVFVGDTARSARETLTIEYRRRREEAKMDGFDVPQLRLSDCNKALLDILWASPAVIVIDAIDEVQETRMHELIDSLNYIAAEASSVVKICITSRHTNNLAARLHDPVTIHVNKVDSRTDMELFVRQRVDNAILNKRLLGGKVSEDLQNWLMDRFVNIASDMFLWVDLQIESLCRMHLDIDVENAVQRLSTDTLHARYAEIFENINDDGPAARKIINRAFSWLLCSYEAHSPSSFLSAVSNICYGSTERLGDISSLTTICRGLVVIDTKLNVVRFMHSSLEEFLFTKAEFSLSKYHGLVAEACLSICMRGFGVDTATKTPGARDIYEYSALNWPRHCHCAQSESTSLNAVSNMMDFVFDEHDTSIFFLDWMSHVKKLAEKLYYHHHLRKPLEAVSNAEGTPLFLACAFGLVDIVHRLGDAKNTDWNLRNPIGHTGIYLAGAFGHVDIVDYLLRKGAEPSPSGGHFGTPLHAAAFKGHLAVVQSLLDRHGDDDYNGSFGTALEASFTGGREEVALAVLKSRPNIMNQQEYDLAVSRAAKAGFMDVIHYLETNFEYKYSSSPPAKARSIKSAIMKGSFPVLRHLISTLGNHLAEPELKLPPGTISAASLAGHNDIIVLLLDHGENIEEEGPYGKPLRVACLLGHESTVRLLLDKGANVNADGVHGDSLQAAAMQGHLAIARILMRAGAKIIRRGGLFDTALEAAAVRGHYSVAEELLKVGITDSEYMRSHMIENSFKAAVAAGQEDILRLWAEVGCDWLEDFDIFEGHAHMLPAPENKDLIRAASPKSCPDPEEQETLTANIPDSQPGVLDECTGYPSVGILQQVFLGDSAEDQKQSQNTRVSDRQMPSLKATRNVPPLVDAAMRNDQSLVMYILQSDGQVGTYVNDQDVSWAILTAVENDNMDVVHLLLNDDFNILDSVISAAKSMAAAGNHKMVETLLAYIKRSKRCPKPHEVYHDSVRDVLLAGCEGGQAQVVELVVDLMNQDPWFGKHPSAKESVFSDAFMKACIADQSQVLPPLTTEKLIPDLFNLQCKALRKAAENGSFRTVQFLVENGSQNFPLEIYNNAILASSGNGHTEVVRWLAAKFKGTESYQSMIERAHHLAALQERLEAVRSLVQEVADINAVVQEFTGFDDERQFGNLTMPQASTSPLQAVISTFKRSRHPDLSSIFFFHHWQPSSHNGRGSIIKLLLDHGADVWSLGGFSETPLLRAMKHCSIEVVRWMLERVQEPDDALAQELLHAAASREISPASVMCEISQHGTAFQLENTDCSQLVTTALRFFDISKDRGYDPGIGRFIYSNNVNDVLDDGPGAVIKMLLPLCPNTCLKDARYGLLLQMAAVKDDVMCVNMLLDRGLDPNIDGGYYHTALQAAARVGNIETVKLLLTSGADPNKAGGSCDIPLRAAVKGQHREIVDILIAYGADVNIPVRVQNQRAMTDETTSLLQIATEIDDLGIAKALLDAGADTNAAPPEGSRLSPAIIEACRAGNLDMLRLLLEKGANPNLEGPRASYPPVFRETYMGIENTSALHVACAAGHEALVHELLAYGVDFEKHVTDSGTPLCAAARGGHLSIVRILLDAGANVDEGVNGSALWFASRCGHHPVVEELIASGATLGIRKYSRNALRSACSHRYMSIINFLLVNLYGTAEEVAACDDAMVHACNDQRDDTLNLLLEYGIRPYFGLLHQACKFGLLESVKTLLAKFADPNEPDGEGARPLQIAVAYRKVAVARVLLKQGADVNFEDAKYGSPLIAALEGLATSGLNHLDLEEPYQDIAAKLPYPKPIKRRFLPMVPNESVERVSPEDQLSSMSYTSIIHLLIEHGANPNTEMRNFGNALHLALFIGDDSIVRLLLDKGADVNAVGGYFGTALQAAREKNHAAVIELLDAHGAKDSE